MRTQAQIERRIARIQTEIAGLGPIHPGSMSEQYNVCGTPGCVCKDPHHPQKHGPYYHLSYTWRGKGGTRFVRGADVAAMREKLATYKRLRELVNEWVDLALEHEALARAAGKGKR
jgi:hypothetical protein